MSCDRQTVECTATEHEMQIASLRDTIAAQSGTIKALRASATTPAVQPARHS